MTAIRHLIEAHKAARRAFDLSGGPDEADHHPKAKDALLRALVAEPVNSLDGAHAKARYLLDGDPDAREQLRWDDDMMKSLFASFFQVDPVLYAIENHERAVRKLDAIEGETREFDRASSAALDAWVRLIETVPTTMDGTIAFIQYVAAWPDLNALVGDQGAPTAMRSLAKAFDRMAGGESGA